MMKYRLSLFALVCVSVLLLCGCKEASKSRLNAAVDDFNKNCPAMMNQFVMIQKVEYADDVVSMYVVMDDKISNINVLRENKELVKENILNTFSRGNEKVKKFLETITEAGADLKGIYSSSADGDNSFSVLITCDELKEALESDGQAEAMDVDKIIQVTNLNMPIQLNEYVTLVGMVKDGDCVYYDYDVSGVIFDKVTEDLEFSKMETLNNLRNMSPGDKEQMRPIYTSGMNLGYRYHNVDTDATEEFVIANSELEGLF